MQTSFGLVLPMSFGNDVPEPEPLWEIVEAADASALDYLWVSDHLLWWHPMHESLSLLAAVAARTSRIRLGTAVLLLAMRDPVITAKAIATVDRLSNGRITVGVGIGGEFPPEWEAVGISRKSRAKRTDEMITALRGLWGREPFTMKTRHLDLEHVDLYPKPKSPPPIWIGGRKDGALARAARFGDGWMGIFLTPERYRESLETLRRQAADFGRGDDTIRPSLYLWMAVAENSKAARANAEALLSGFYNVAFEKLERYTVWGDKQRCTERLREFRDCGVENFAIAPLATSFNAETVGLIEEVTRALN